MSLISIADLMLRAQQLRQSTGQTTAVFLVILVMYFVIAQVLSTSSVRYLERRTDIMLGRRPGREARSPLETRGWPNESGTGTSRADPSGPARGLVVTIEATLLGSAVALLLGLVIG